MRNYGCRVTENLVFKGMRTLILENECLRVMIILDKGAEIAELLYKPLDIDFMLQGPDGILPVDQPALGSATAGFLDSYSGGWQEILPNGGPPATYAGATYGQHGNSTLVPWDYTVLEDSPEQIAVEFSLRILRTPLHISKVLRLSTGDPRLVIEERLENLGRDPFEFLWGHHIAYGKNFITPETELRAACRTVVVHDPEGRSQNGLIGGSHQWPLVPTVDGQTVDLSQFPAETGWRRMTYLTDFEQGEYTLYARDKGVGLTVEWDKELFPYLWFWQEIEAGGYPWYGRMNATALEPWTTKPTVGLPEAAELELTRKIEPNQVIETQVDVSVTQDPT